MVIASGELGEQGKSVVTDATLSEAIEYRFRRDNHAIISNMVNSVLVKGLDFKQLVEYYFHTEWKKAGGVYVCHCPFHWEKTPSFTYHEEKGTFHCFGCHKSGSSVLKFLELVETALDDDDWLRFRLPGEYGNIYKEKPVDSK